MHLLTTRLFCALLGLSGAAALLAQSIQPATLTAVPRLVRLNNSFHPANGLAPAAVESATLSIYSDQTGGTALWQETQNVPMDSDGRYSVLLGATRNDGLPMDLFKSGEPRWLGVQFNRTGEVEQSRVLMASVPYALKAADAETLGGQPASAYMLAPSADASASPASASTSAAGVSVNSAKFSPRTNSGSAGSIGKFTNTTDLVNSVMVETSGMIGLGTGVTAPLDYMHVQFTNTNGQFTGYAVQNLGNTSTSFSGMLFFDQNGNLGQFQGFNNLTHEYRINNIAKKGGSGPFDGSINFMIGSSSKFLVASNGNIGIGNPSPSVALDVAGSVKASGGIIYGDGTQQITASPNPLSIALLHWYPANLTTQFGAGSGPSFVAFTGDSIWVTNNLSTGTIIKVRTSDGAPLIDVTVGTNPYGIVFDGANVWAININSNNVTKVRSSDGTPLGTFNVCPGPQLAAFDGTNIWVTCAGGNDVTILRATDGANQGTVGVGNGPSGIAYDGANMWVAYSGTGTVQKLRGSDGANLGTFVGTNPQFVTFDAANIWVSNAGSNTVTKLQASDGTNLGTFNVGAHPTGMAFDGASLWVANSKSGTVTKLRATDGTTLGTFTLGTNPVGVAFDGANIWVANNDVGTVSKL